MLGDKIIQYTSFIICLQVTIDKKISWDKDVQTAATSFTALKILIWKKIHKLSGTNSATVYSK